MERLNAVLPIRDIFSRVILNCCGQSALETDVLAGEDVVGGRMWSAGYPCRGTEERIRMCGRTQSISIP